MQYTINSKKNLKIKQILDKLDNFYSYAITKIRILVDVQYAICKLLHILNYVAKLLKNNNFFYNNIENVSNKKLYYKSFAYRLKII